MNQALIVDGVRTPVGRRGGALRGWHPVDLMAHTLEHLVARSGVVPASIEDAIVGVTFQRGEQTGNLARTAVLAAGLPDSVPGTTIDRQCGSGQQAVHVAAQAIRAGDQSVVLAGGVESMTRVDLGPLFDPSAPPGEWYGERLVSRYGAALPPQGVSAERVIDQWGFTRRELDEFAVRSHRRAAAAADAGHGTADLVPITGLSRDGASVDLVRDEGIRPDSTVEVLGGLRPAFGRDGRLTGGNSSQLSDGAAALLLASDRAAAQAGLRPRARVVAATVAGADPLLQFTAIIPATRKALASAGVSLSDIDLVEVNEAFAPVPLLWQREFGYPLDQINVNGGSIAIGHPLGSTGARLLVTLIGELERRDARYGLLTVCEGGGMANATIVERLS